MTYSINKLAKLAGVSVRTLHFYDQIGLLHPNSIAENGYRFYRTEELQRLQQILFFKELKFSLEQIKNILSNPAVKIEDSLNEQLKLLCLERSRLDEIIKTVEKTISLKKGHQQMSDEELFSGLSRAQIEEYTEEAKQRWGNTNAFKQSQDRYQKMSKADLARISQEQENNARALGELMHLGPEAPEVQALIDAQFHFINDNFYDLDLEMFYNLAVMTTQDERYAAYYIRFHPELPRFRLEAVKFYCGK